MFRKLIKYEWIAIMRAMLPVYGAVLLLSVANVLISMVQRALGNSFEDNLPLIPYLQATAAFLYTAVLIGMAVFAVVVMIQRFYKGLLKQEGYLMFTLPVRSWELALSKAVVALLMGAVSMLVAFLSVGILGGMDFLKALIHFPEEFFALLRECFEINGAALGKAFVYGLEVLVLSLVAMMAWIYRLYASMALGQLCKNHKVLFSTLWFVGLDILIRIAGITFISSGIPERLDALVSMKPQSILHVILTAGIGYNLIFLAIFWVVTNYVLEKKLNLE